jgi:hypothetical protein
MVLSGVLRALMAPAEGGLPAAPRVTSPVPGDIMSELVVLRRAVWSAWFSGDTAALRHYLGPELVAIGPDARPWHDFEGSVREAARFAASGGRLVSIEFPRTLGHRFGGAIILFSEYRATLQLDGATRVVDGRATEVFIRSGGRWVHTSWHLDAVG